MITPIDSAKFCGKSRVFEPICERGSKNNLYSWKKKLFEPNNAYLDGMICLSNINKWL